MQATTSNINQSLSLAQHQRNSSVDSTQLLDNDSCSLSSRMLTHNTLAQKLEVWRRGSKNSPAFYKKLNASILKGGDQPQALKLVSTPSIPMPERFYYEQNPQLHEFKRRKLEEDNLLSKSVQVPPQTNGFQNFKRVSSLDHHQLVAREKAKRLVQLRTELGFRNDAGALEAEERRDHYS